MSEISPTPPSTEASDIGSLCISISRLSQKISLIQDAIRDLNQNRVQLEGKIDDAHKRVQRILSRLPDQSDGRQLNLLGEAIPPNTSEDDNEPTTH